MEAFWKYLYFLTGTVGLTFIVKYISNVYIAKYKSKEDEDE